MRCFLLIANINEINLHVVSIREHFISFGVYLIYLVHLHLVLHFSQKYFNILKGVLYVKKWAIGLLIILSRSVMTQKRNLVIITTNIKFDQIINRIYNTELPSMKVLIIMNIYVTHDFGDLSINTYDDYMLKQTIESFYTESELFHISFGQLEGSKFITVVNILADNTFKYQIILSDETVLSITTPASYIFNLSTDL